MVSGSFRIEFDPFAVRHKGLFACQNILIDKLPLIVIKSRPVLGTFHAFFKVITIQLFGTAQCTG